MSDLNVYGAHLFGKHSGVRSEEWPIACIMMNDTKRRIILKNNGVYLKDMLCVSSEDHTISQQNVCHKAYEVNLKNKVKDVTKDENIENYGQVTYETNSRLLRLCFWNCI